MSATHDWLSTIRMVGCATSIAIVGCADPAAHAPRGGAAGDGGTETLAPRTQSDAVVLEASPVLTPAPARPTSASTISLVAPSGARCRIDHAPGDCDRCPDRECRQVRLTLDASPEESEWAQFCDQGDVREEALIACLCAGSTLASCERAAQETAVALTLVTHVFGGHVPAVGTRYHDADGLRAVVDRATHAWLAAIIAAPETLRCDVPDVDAIEARYQRRSQQVRISGTCE